MKLVYTSKFEFGFGHFIAKTPWKKLLHDYNLLKGRVWSLFLLVELVSPLLVKFMTSTRHKEDISHSQLDFVQFWSSGDSLAHQAISAYETFQTSAVHPDV